MDPIEMSVGHESSAEALKTYMTEWGLENYDITAIPLFLTRRLNEERPRDKTTELLDDE
jgi:hypothetical protein